MNKLLESALELEKAIQEHAFICISKHGDYRKGEELLDAAKLANRLASTLGSIGKAMVKNESPRTKAGSSESAISKQKIAPYPKFFLEGDVLVKVGKGRAKKSREYRHTVPMHHLDQILSVLSALIAQGEKFTLPALIKQIGNGCPEYQIYVTVEALKRLGMLHQITRGHYSRQNGCQVPANANDLKAVLQVQEKEAETMKT